MDSLRCCGIQKDEQESIYHMIKQHEFCYPRDGIIEHTSSAGYNNTRTFLAVL